jgi:hypothetical protein
MTGANNGNPVQFLDLLLDYFADGARWTQGDLDNGDGGRCLVGAIHYLRCRHQIPSVAAESLLQEVLPRGHCHLALFNDRCADIAELRVLIANARALAVAAAGRQRPERPVAARLGRWRILLRFKGERLLRAASGDERPTSSDPAPRQPESERLAA